MILFTLFKLNYITKRAYEDVLETKLSFYQIEKFR